MTVSGQGAEAFFTTCGVIILGVLAVTIFRCWRALAYIRYCLHRRKMEAMDKEIELAKAKHAPIQPAAIAAPVLPVAPVELPAIAPQPPVPPPADEPFFSLNLDEVQPCPRKA